MGLRQVLESGVAAIKALTADIQGTITHERYKEDDSYGNRRYYAAVSYGVIVEHRDRYVTAKDMTQQLSKTCIQFLEPVAVTHQDRITLPGGSKPQIIAIEGVENPDGVMYAARVYF